MEKDRERKNQKKKNPNRFQLGNDLRCGRSRSLRIFRVVSDTREYVENRGGRVRWRGSGGPMVTRDSGRLFHNNISRFVGFFFFFFLGSFRTTGASSPSPPARWSLAFVFGCSTKTRRNIILLQYNFSVWHRRVRDACARVACVRACSHDQRPSERDAETRRRHERTGRDGTRVGRRLARACAIATDRPSVSSAARRGRGARVSASASDATRGTHSAETPVRLLHAL